MRSIAALAAASAALLATTANSRPFTPKDLASLRRLSAPVASPDGRTLVWQQRETDWTGNKGHFDLWSLNLSVKGARPVKLAPDPTHNATDPYYTDDGTLWFLSDRTGEGQVFAIAPGGDLRQVTRFPAGVDGFLPSPDGASLVVWAARRPGVANLAEPVPPKSPEAGSARTYDRLFIRHWDTWADDTRNMLFVLPLANGVGQGRAISIERLDGDAPSRPYGGREELNWSPDSKTVYFTLREAGRIEPLSTNLDIWSVPADGSAEPTNLTAANKAMDTQPAVSPDGKWLAYAAMARPGYESDRLVLQLRELATGKVRALTRDWDRSVGSIQWAKDGKSLLVTAEDEFDVPAFRVDIPTGKVTRLSAAGTVSAMVPLTDGGVIVARDTMLAPADLYRLPPAGGGGTQLTAINADLLAGVDMPTAEKFSFKGAGGDTVWGWAVKPAGVPAGTRLPIAFLIHGGPQGSFGNGWSYRWNPAVMAEAGFGVVTIDFHGSTGHGQAFTDAINQDWGGKPLEDLRLGLAAATARYGWLDESRACALGGSYGGFMTNWIAGNWPDRFKCLVTHAGVFDARGMAYQTEELWFDEWEHGGRPYYEAPADYERWNPVNMVDRWQTPMLVIHGEKDFRIPYTQGIGAFTALQRRNIPSRLVVFPDENHWVLKPRNSLQWHEEVLGWLKRWTAR
ncbi:prolyl oligopeptidase family serine peptidase [Sphingomonas quercus]